MDRKEAFAVGFNHEEALAGYSEDNLNSIMNMVDSFIRKQYLSELKDAQIVPLNAKLSKIRIGKNVRMFRIVSFSYSETDDLYHKLTNIFNAVSEFSSGQIFILDSDGFRISLYFGIVCNEPDKLSMQFDTFKGSFTGNFPGCRISMLSVAKNEDVLRDIFDEENIKISSVSALAALRELTADNLYHIEHLADGMYGRPFTMLFLSEAVPKSELQKLRQNYEAMYTELSPFREYTVSVNKNESRGNTNTFSMTKSESVSAGKSVTETASFGKSENRSETVDKNEDAQEGRAKNQLMGTALSLAMIMSGVGLKTAEKINPLQGIFYGGSISNIMGSVQTLLNGVQPGRTETSGEGESYSISFSEGETTSRQEGFSTMKSISENRGDSAGSAVQMRYENRLVADLLELLHGQITRLQQIEVSGGFNCAAYFVTGDNAAALTAANMYRSLLGGKDSLGQSHAVNLWSEPEKVKDICEYLKRLNHPVFHFECRPGYPVFTAGSLVGANEIPMYVSIPKKSLGGFPAAVRAEFARDVLRTTEDFSDKIEIGKIFHMGKTTAAKVCLSKNDLSGHMFVAGTTGMGKSNFCYGLIDELRKKDIRFMVIEPAKGEYRQVFGGIKDIHIFGTNPNLTPLLKINPFSFPDGIHVNEHMNRLLELFKSCWPMYAAMPEVMKEGIELIYRRCGYNLITGKNNGGGRFPSFRELLDVLPEVIRKSEFSDEVKGNYIGSLATRVKSLTDGLYGCIFTEKEIAPHILFDENVLIDLSRAGSAETKSLIMGILVIKLQEYRTCRKRMNIPLSHITVLEEAHHLLRAETSSSPEGVNIRAASLEMITNAIAEMRTYGEGFVIADQSPSLMDLSVIRNTNTKVAFKLPEQSDCMAMGNAMSLSKMQMNELSRLEKGVAAVCQSGWDNPVLSKINYFDPENFCPYTDHAEYEEIHVSEAYSQALAVLMRDRLSEGEKSSLDMGLCAKLMQNPDYIDYDGKESLSVIHRYLKDRTARFSFPELCRIADSIIDSRKLLRTCGNMETPEGWEKRAMLYAGSIVDLTEDELRALLLLCLNMHIRASEKNNKMYYRYFAYCEERKAPSSEAGGERRKVSWDLTRE